MNADWTQTMGNARHLMRNVAANEYTKEIWSADFGEGFSKRNVLLAAPIIYGGKVYAQDARGTVSAFDLKTGKGVFETKLKPSNKHDSSSGLNGAGLAADNNRVYALTGFGGVFALNAETGDIIWQH